MNDEIEEGFRAFLMDKLAAEEFVLDAGPPEVKVVAAEVEGVRVSLHTNCGSDVLSNAIAWAVIQAKAKPDVRTLWTGEITLLISTPSDVPEYTMEKHKAIVRRFKKELFAAGNQAALSAAVRAASTCSVHGYYFQTPENGSTDTRWQAKIPFNVGLHEHPEDRP